MGEKKLSILIKSIITVVTGVLVFLITTYHIEVFQVIWNIGKICWKVFVFKVQLQLWMIIILGILALKSLISLFAFYIGSIENELPFFYDYTEDKFLGVVWRWKWNNKILVDLKPYCPKCDTLMIGKRFGIFSPITIYCETCNYETDEITGEPEEKVLRQIDRELRNRKRKLKIDPLSSHRMQ